MASREELLDSIRPDMKLTRAFFLKIYGYEITWPGFAEEALWALEMLAGCSKVREYYQRIVDTYEEDYKKEMKEVGKWYAQWCDKNTERQVKKIDGPTGRIFTGFPENW